jgi:aldose 1-epimerase
MIEKRAFGALKDGRCASLYTIKNARGASVQITDFGGNIVSINVPDKDGNLIDVALGYPDVGPYEAGAGQRGSLIGRVGNRINRGECTLNGAPLHLAKNANGHHLHGGDVGFDKKLWDATPVEEENSLILTYVSPDGEENYPGTLRVKVTYAFDERCALSIHYEAVSDKDTLVNLTNHCYFNLEGEASRRSVADHLLRIDADSVTVADEDLIPTGEIRKVDGTPFDLRAPKRVGDGLSAVDTNRQLRYGNGYDHNFMLNGEGLRNVATVTCARTGIEMNVATDKPAVQLYTTNAITPAGPGVGGYPYQSNAGLCLETQFPPDAINHENFPGGVLRADEAYDYTTIYAFSVR